MARRPGLTITELQEQIFAREGFRVSFERLGASDDPLPPYAYAVMAPNGWKVSDWQRVRLAAYIALFRGVTVYRGDQKPIGRDLTLGHLRDSYYEAEYGSLTSETPTTSAALATTAPPAGEKRKQTPRSTESVG